MDPALMLVNFVHFIELDKEERGPLLLPGTGVANDPAESRSNKSLGCAGPRFQEGSSGNKSAGKAREVTRD
jgi:hypothetical protein